MRKGYIVYRHVLPDDSVYIGVTNQSCDKRWSNGLGYKQSDTKFFRKIVSVGWSNIKHEILAKGLSKNEAISKEREMIKTERVNRGIGKVLNTQHNTLGKLHWSDDMITIDLIKEYKHYFVRWDDRWLDNVRARTGSLPFITDIREGYITFTFVSLNEGVVQYNHISCIYPDYVYSFRDLYEWLFTMKDGIWVEGQHESILEKEYDNIG